MSSRSWLDDVCRVGRTRRPVRVVAARAPDDVAERRVELVQQLRFLLRPGAPGELRLVDALERQLRPEPLERGRQLRPDRVVAAEHTVVVGRHVQDPLPRVVVDVDHDVEVTRQRPADDLLDAVQVRRLDHVARRRTEVRAPRDGKADALETLRLHVVQQRFRDPRVAPRRLVAAGRVEGVAEVPPRLHRRDVFFRGTPGDVVTGVRRHRGETRGQGQDPGQQRAYRPCSTEQHQCTPQLSDSPDQWSSDS